MKAFFAFRTTATALAILAGCGDSLQAQLYGVPLEQRLANSELAIEGEVVQSRVPHP